MTKSPSEGFAPPRTWKELKAHVARLEERCRVADELILAQEEELIASTKHLATLREALTFFWLRFLLPGIVKDWLDFRPRRKIEPK